MLGLVARLLLTLCLSACAVMMGHVVGRVRPGASVLAYSDAALGSAPNRTYLVDIQAAVTYRLSPIMGSYALVDWLTPRRLLMRQLGAEQRYFIFEFGVGPRALRIPEDCREATLRGRRDFLSCLGRQGGGLLVFSAACALGTCADSPRRWVPGAQVADHLWSPDGTRIAYLDTSLRSAGLAILDLRSADVRPLNTVTGASLSQASWSPDAARLAYFSRGPNSISMQIFDVQARVNLARLALSGMPPDRPPSWSPDGEQIVTSQSDRFGADIFMFDVADATVSWVTDGKQASANPAWSPDGRYLAYLVARDQRFELYTSTITGEERRPLALLSPLATYAWQPCDVEAC